MTEQQVRVLLAAKFVLNQLIEQQLMSDRGYEAGYAAAVFDHAADAITQVFNTAAIYLQDPVADAATNAKAAAVGGRA